MITTFLAAILPTLSSANPEDVTLAVQEFIAQFLPQFLPTFEKYSIIFTGVVAGLGLLVTIIVSIVKWKSSKNKLKAAITPYQRNKELIDTMKTDVLDRLQGTFDVDITNKINPLLESITDKTNKDIAIINEKINAIAQAQLVLMQIFNNAGSLTPEEYTNVQKVLTSLPDTIAQHNVPAHITLSLKGDIEQPKEKHKIAV